MTDEGMTAEYFDQQREARADLGYLRRRSIQARFPVWCCCIIPSAGTIGIARPPGDSGIAAIEDQP
jgi:hypothetical protein